MKIKKKPNTPDQFRKYIVSYILMSLIATMQFYYILHNSFFFNDFRIGVFKFFGGFRDIPIFVDFLDSIKPRN